MTTEEKQAIINYCRKNAGALSFRESGLLDYYLDHKDEINVSSIMKSQQKEDLDTAQKQLADAQAHLDELTNQKVGQ